MKLSEINRKSLFLHSFVVEKLRSNPSVLSEAITTIEHWKIHAPADSMYYVDKWRELCSQGVEGVIAMLQDPTDIGSDMRQCSPFGNLLSAEERWAAHAQWREIREKRAS